MLQKTQPRYNSPGVVNCSHWNMQARAGMQVTTRISPEVVTPRLYYCMQLGSELDVLLITLYEIYPAVDVIVLSESRKSHSGEEKGLLFHQNQNLFAPFMSKVRYIEFTEKDCPGECNSWDREQAQRRILTTGLEDAMPDDLVIVADVDELPAREFLWAAKYCEAVPSLYDVPWLPPSRPTADAPYNFSRCERRVVLISQYQHYFDCGSPQSHCHPDLVRAACAKNWTTERVRMWDVRSNLPFPIEKLFRTQNYQIEWTFTGWHMRSFVSLSQHQLKFQHYAERNHANIPANSILDSKMNCQPAEKAANDGSYDASGSFFKVDSLAVMALPHLISDRREVLQSQLQSGESWNDWAILARFIQYVEEGQGSTLSQLADYVQWRMKIDGF